MPVEIFIGNGFSFVERVGDAVVFIKPVAEVDQLALFGAEWEVPGLLFIVEEILKRFRAEWAFYLHGVCRCNGY